MKTKGGDSSTLAREVVNKSKGEALPKLQTANCLRSMVYF